MPKQMQQSKHGQSAPGPNRRLGCFRSMITELWRPTTAEQATALQPTSAHKLDPATADELVETLFLSGGRRPQPAHE